jgi:signal transduction histidine kinase
VGLLLAAVISAAVTAETAQGFGFDGWFVSQEAVALVLFSLVAFLLAWWVRERQILRQNRTLRAVLALSEEAIAIESQAALTRRIDSVLKPLFGACAVELHILSVSSNTLEGTGNADGLLPDSIPADCTIGSLGGAVAACYRNRALLTIPDTQASPLITEHREGLPRAAILVPLFAASDVVGVLTILFRKRKRAPQTTQITALQHLGNQIASSRKLLEQQSIREQLLRSEKMAAAGQLITGVANDLRKPLESIRTRAKRLMGESESRPELLEIAGEAQRGFDMIRHVLALSGLSDPEPQIINVHGVLHDLLDMREAERKRKLIRLECDLPLGPADVLADRVQLEKALLTALIHAEHAAYDSPDRVLSVSSRTIGRRLQITLDCRPGTRSDPFELRGASDALGFPVAQAIVRSFGGEMRPVTLPGGEARIEIEMPEAGPSRPETETVPRPRTSHTALVLETDPTLLRDLMTLLSSRGQRAIPVSTPNEVLDMTQRMQFDLIFCPASLQSANWVHLFSRVRKKVGHFILMAEVRDVELERLLENGHGLLCPRPLTESDLDRLLDQLG